MEEMIKQIKDQQDINFINIREQILVPKKEDDCFFVLKVL